MVKIKHCIRKTDLCMKKQVLLFGIVTLMNHTLWWKNNYIFYIAIAYLYRCICIIIIIIIITEIIQIIYVRMKIWK